MPARPLCVLAATAALGGLVAGCGSSTSGSSADEQARVRAVLTRFGSATARGDYQAICDDLIAKAMAQDIEEYGIGCAVFFKQGLSAAQSPRLQVQGIAVKGSAARARVRTTAANQAPLDTTLQLAKQAGQWRITGLGAEGPGAGAKAPTTKTAPPGDDE